MESKIDTTIESTEQLPSQLNQVKYFSRDFDYNEHRIQQKQYIATTLMLQGQNAEAAESSSEEEEEIKGDVGVDQMQ